MSKDINSNQTIIDKIIAIYEQSKNLDTEVMNDLEVEIINTKFRPEMLKAGQLEKLIDIYDKYQHIDQIINIHLPTKLHEIMFPNLEQKFQEHTIIPRFYESNSNNKSNRGSKRKLIRFSEMGSNITKEIKNLDIDVTFVDIDGNNIAHYICMKSENPNKDLKLIFDNKLIHLLDHKNQKGKTPQDYLQTNMANPEIPTGTVRSTKRQKLLSQNVINPNQNSR